MPFRPDPFLDRVEPLRKLRQRPVLGYGIAVLAVGASAGLRLALGDILADVPFITFYPAVAVAAAAGAGPGLFGLGLAAAAANFLFLPPAYSFSLGLVGIFETGLFMLVAGMILLLIVLLNQAIDRLWNQAETGKLILESQPAGIVAVDSEGKITLVNSAVERQLGYAREELLDHPVEMLVPSPLRTDHVASRLGFIEHPEPRRMGAGRDLHAVTKAGSLLPVEIGLNPVHQNGRDGALATIVDISERKKLEWRMQVLSNEVRHRSRNLLTIVQALAHKMLPAEAAQEFLKTLAALGRTHDMFGASTTAPLRGIVEGELAGFRDQARIQGCELLLTARAAQDFTLILHELVTNSIKYGALSGADGRVTVTGRVGGEGLLRFSWKEAGGPPVGEPERQGLGRTILHDLALGFATQVAIDYSPEGLSYRLSAPAARIANVAELASARSPA
jgi:PAS domain S-box-containing protein